MTDRDDILKNITDESHRIMELLLKANTPDELASASIQFDTFTQATNIERLAYAAVDALKRVAKGVVL